MAGTLQAAAAGRVVVMFPSGRLAYWNGLRLRERPWKSTFVTLALKYDLPVIPIHIAARNSWAFYALSQISTELRDVQSIREAQNKAGTPYRITFGRPIPPSDLDDDPDRIAARLQGFVEDVLPKAPDAVWNGSEGQSQSLLRNADGGRR
jgi:putative hemolysin